MQIDKRHKVKSAYILYIIRFNKETLHNLLQDEVKKFEGSSSRQYLHNDFKIHLVMKFNLDTILSRDSLKAAL